MDPVRQAELHEQIKEKVIPDYKREEPQAIPDTEITSISNILKVEQPDQKSKEKLGFIASNIKAEDNADLLYQVRQIENRLAPPKLGESRLDVVYGFLRAKAAVDNAEKLRDSYLG